MSFGQGRVNPAFMSSAPNLRPASRADLPALYAVCLQTGDGGGDATGQFSDPAWLGHRFVGPYVVLEPAWSWTLEDAGGPCGYLLGTPDSLRFARRFEEQWMPEIAPELEVRLQQNSCGVTSLELEQRNWFADRQWVFPEPLTEYPAHLHIDLLPRARGLGHGRAMVNQQLESFAAAGVPGVHLGMHPDNLRALKFYQALGFTELTRMHGVLYLAQRLT